MLPAYEITEIIGAGGMGAVYKGRQANLDRSVAIKLLPETLAEVDGMDYAERFKTEAKAMANLDHPGIISVYDFGQTERGHLYFVMEFLDGMDIHQYLEAHDGSVEPGSAVSVVSSVLDALQYAHDHFVVHRDIKPANVMLNMEGRVKIADFGLAKRQMDPEASLATIANINLGTQDFSAPECFKEGSTADHRADLYAVGVMLYQMLTGEIPRGRWKPVSELKPGLDPRFNAVLNRALESDPSERFQNATEFNEQLVAVLSAPPKETVTAPVEAKARPKLNTEAVSLKSTSRVPAAGKTPAAKVASLAAPQSSPGSSKSTLWVVLGTVAALIAGVGIFLAMSDKEESVSDPEIAVKSPSDASKPAPEAKSEAKTPVSPAKPGAWPTKPGTLRLAGNLGKGRVPKPEETRDIVACGADDHGFHAVNADGELFLFWNGSLGEAQMRGNLAPGGNTGRPAIFLDDGSVQTWGWYADYVGQLEDVALFDATYRYHRRGIPRWISQSLERHHRRTVDDV